MQAVAGSKPFALETCSDSVCYLIGLNAEYLRYKGACHDSQTDSLDAPLVAVPSDSMTGDNYVLTVPPGRCYVRFSGLSVPPNTELELSLIFSLRGQQHTTHCTIHHGIMKCFHITITAVGLKLLL